MKALKFDENTQAIVVVEKGDRFVALPELSSAIIIEDRENKEEGAKITNLFPENLPDGDVPFSVTLAACIRVFLDDPDWVDRAHKILEEKAEKQA